jgi:hypothetical protein
MAGRDKVQVDLIKLTNGDRILRLTELTSGLSLEKKLDASQSVLRQKERLLDIFDAVLARARAAPA